MRFAMAHPCLGSSGLKGEGLQDEEIERTLDEIVWLTHTMTVYTSNFR
jgi:hypothetical protein